MIGTLVALMLAAAPGQAVAPQADNPASELGDRQLAGQRIVTAFEGTSPPPALVRMIREGRIAGVILFSSNFSSESQARALASKLRRIRQPRGLRQPLLIGVDQEGGLVKRLPGPPSASAAAMGSAGPEAAARQGRATGNYLDRLGFNADFAPVLDLAIPGGEIERTDRGFAGTVRGVNRTALAFARALERSGVASTAKHFPGYGTARENTDDTAQTLSISRKRLRTRDEAPFGAFAKNGGDMVMLANAIYPALDKRHPAGLSYRVATRELRGEAGFDGVSITDSLNAAAITRFGSPPVIARMGAQAGTDLLLFTGFGAARAAADGLAKDLRTGLLARGKFEESVNRTLELRSSLRD